MRAVGTSLLLLQISSHLPGCASSSSFGRRGGVHPRAASKKSPIVRRQSSDRVSRDVLDRPRRGGQQQPASSSDGAAATGSYHGNYVSSTADGQPPAAAAVTAVTADVRTTVPAAAPPAAPSQPALASATSVSSKLSNLQERTGPAVVMLGLVYLILKYAGANGLIGMVLAMQVGLYSESTSVVEDFAKEGGGAGGDAVASFPLQKWWWFATAVMMTSGRKMLVDKTSLNMNQMNLITFLMSAASLIGAVVQLAMVSSSAAEDIYRRYLGRVACCHFSLLFLVGQSSFWIKTVSEYGLVWVLFPALLVIVNDTMAYVFGVLLGKHKLLPRLSPKKTVEGFLGAGISTVAVARPLLRRMGGEGGVTNAGRHALILALYASLVSPFGGFLASAVKRAHGAKDFGALIPGHGGVVDRFDCQVVTAPFVYLYLKNCLSPPSA